MISLKIPLFNDVKLKEGEKLNKTIFRNLLSKIEQEKKAPYRVGIAQGSLAVRIPPGAVDFTAIVSWPKNTYMLLINPTLKGNGIEGHTGAACMSLE